MSYSYIASQKSENSMACKSGSQTMNKRKQLINEEMASFDKSFAFLQTDLNHLKNRTMDYLEKLLHINYPQDFNKEFAMSRSFVTAVQDFLSNFEEMMADDLLMSRLSNKQNSRPIKENVSTEELKSKHPLNIKENCFVEEQDLNVQDLKLTISKLSPDFANGIVPVVISPWMFYFQPLFLVPQLEILQDNLNSYMKKQIGNYQKHYKLSSVVAARYSADQNWYRAKITSITELENHRVYEVFFVDYGNSEIIDCSSLRDLPGEFEKLPSLAICCSLNKASPPDGSCVWSTKSTLEFKTLISHSQLCEPITIEPVTAVNNALVFVNLSKRSSKILQNHTLPLEVLQELNKMGCLQILQSNRNAIKWFKYFCYSEDEKRNFRGDTFLNKMKSFNSTEILEMNPIEKFKPKVALPKITKDDIQIKENKNFESKSQIENNVILESPVIDENQICIHTKQNTNNIEPLFGNACKITENIEPLLGDSCEISPTHDIETSETDVNQNYSTNLVSSESSNSERPTGSTIIKDDESYHENICSSIPQTISTSRDEVKPSMYLHHNVAFKHHSISVTDEQLKVHAVNVESPSKFWLIIGKDGPKKLSKMNQNLDKLYQLPKSFKKLHPCKIIEVGTTCLVVQEEGLSDELKGYRSQVMNVLNGSDKNNIEVFLVDYGRTLILNGDDSIFQLPEYFINMNVAMAVQCKLEGVESNGEMWSEEALKYFKDKVTECTQLHAYLGLQYSSGDIVHGCSDKPLEIDLTIIKDDGTEESFITLLSQLGYAKLSNNDARETKYDEREDEKLDESLGKFLKDEMYEEFLSTRNSYAVGVEDPGIAASNYKSNPEKMVCKFFNSKGGCWYNDHCHFAHVQKSDILPTTYKAFACSLPSTELEMELPCEGSWLIVQISAFVDLQNYFVILPFGVDQDISKEPLASPLNEFMKSMNEYYNSKTLPDHDLTLFANGEMVVARSIEFEIWHRGIVIDYDDDSYEVYFVDYGNTEKLPTSRIRTMNSTFMHLPYQALKCSSNILPTGLTWNQEALDYFKSLVEGQTLVANVLQGFPCGSQLLELYFTDGREEKNVRKVMIERGYAIQPSN